MRKILVFNDREVFMQKKSWLIGVAGLLVLSAGAADAQMMGEKQAMMQEYGKQQREAIHTPEEAPMYPQMMGGYGPGSCINDGYGMAPGMVGFGMGPNMMRGYGMGPNHHGGMMGRYGMGPGNMMGFTSPAQYDAFMDATKDLRRKMHSLRFEYGEMVRDPKTTMGDLRNKEREMFELQQQILEKMSK